MEINDDITVNGSILYMAHGNDFDMYKIKLKSGDVIWIRDTDVNTVRPHMTIPTEDRRKGS